MKYPTPGLLYRHYKGGLYKVLHLAKHTEKDETLVIYKSLHFGSYHARPLESWNERVIINPSTSEEKTIDRFEHYVF